MEVGDTADLEVCATAGLEVGDMADLEVCATVSAAVPAGRSCAPHASRFASHARACLRTPRAFTLIELMVTIGLLSFIVLGLMAMFNQTQRAFRAGMSQTDILESGRATMEMIARELEQTTPSEYPYLRVEPLAATNFFVEPNPGFNNPPLAQELPGNYDPRTNVVQRFFFLTKNNQDWIGTAYQVIPDDVNGCVGSLYRLAATNISPQGPITVSAAIRYAGAISKLNAANPAPGVDVTNVPYFDKVFNAWVTTSVNRIADGIVHLRIRAFATNGFLIVTNVGPFGNLGTNGMFPVGTNASFGLSYTNVWDTSVYGGPLDREQWACYFMREAVPAYVEIELGILEPQVLRKYRSIPIAAAQRQYLSNHVAEVHIFRQRVPIRNVDYTAYP